MYPTVPKGLISLTLAAFLRYVGPLLACGDTDNPHVVRHPYRLRIQLLASPLCRACRAAPRDVYFFLVAFNRWSRGHVKPLYHSSTPPLRASPR